MESSRDSPGSGAYAEIAETLRRAALAGPETYAGVREQVIVQCLPLAEHVASRFLGRGEQFDDLVQVARVGLVNAVDRFDPEKGMDFLSFAIPTMLGVLRRHFRDTGWAARVPRRVQETYLRVNTAVAEAAQELGRAPTYGELAERLGIGIDEVREAMRAGNGYHARSIDAPTGDDDRPTLAERLGTDDPAFDLVTEYETLRPAVERLSERERTVLALRFYRSMTQSQIAARLGISQMHVSRILAKTLDALRAGAGDVDDSSQ